ncbi:hypothetical protein [Nocardia pseudobrasiliensis]|uniref:hypothetical protein n=1 Tax=Nocardia pseudobrasiliensis TaxID=45979 RepID=UPI0012E80E51|nr:hypothetical protein [Nocardia pseudobrasiliensis]
MVEVGDRVRLTAGGVHVFEVVEIEDEQRAVVVAVGDAPGRYPFSTQTRWLVPATDEG